MDGLTDIPAALQASPIGSLVLLGLLTAFVLGLMVIRSRRSSEIERIAQSQERLAAELTHLSHRLESGRSAGQAEMAGRLDTLGNALNRTVAEQARRTGDGLSTIGERLAIIDSARSTITDLSGRVDALHAILADKRARGRFGEARMEAILRDALPAAAYSFQATLSNGARPDALLRLGGERLPLAIDAKFPLEGWQAFRTEEPGDRSVSLRRMQRDMAVHVDAVSRKYRIAGETQDLVFLFVPSESLFADLHEHSPNIVERAARKRVVLLSPSLLLLAVQLVQTLLADAAIAEAAGEIEAEVRAMSEDLASLGTEMSQLRRYFDNASGQIDTVEAAVRRLTRRGQRFTLLRGAGRTDHAETGDGSHTGEAGERLRFTPPAIDRAEP